MDTLSSLEPIFKPKSVAVIGASTAPGKLGHDILANLINGGFAGPIYPVNPKADEILGLKVYKSVAEAPAAPELAVVVIPARLVPGTLEQAAAVGVKAAVVITGGFAEAGEEGERLQEELAQVVRKTGIRVIGPNCQGVNLPHHQMCASWPLITAKGKIAFASQSGTVGAAFLDLAAAEKLGVSAFISLGNRVDVDEAEVISYFNTDPHTQVIALYLEGVKRPTYFLDALHEAQKPVVILKAGRTRRGSLAAESHTKSLAGTDAVYDALFDKYKVYRADTFEELFDFAKALAYLPPPRGPRLMITTSSGGAAILAIDEAEKCGLETPDPSPSLKEALRQMVPAHCPVGNPVDLTGDVMADPSLYKKVMDATRTEFDTQVVIFGDPIPGACQQVTPGASELVIFLGGAEVEREEREKLYTAGIPVFPTPERGVKALSQFFRFKAPAATPAIAPGAIPGAPPQAPGLELIPAFEAAVMMSKAGIPAASAPLAVTADEAVTLAQGFGYPVALKVASPDFPHKTDVGGVYLHLQEDAAVRTAFKAIQASAYFFDREANIEGVTVSPMAKPGGLEIILGILTDPQYGPVLMFGLGGIYAEIYQDVAFCLLPAEDAELTAMIKKIKGYPLLAGFRGLPKLDTEALLQAMKALARYAFKHPELDQIELNPLLLYPKGLFAVDVRIFSRV
ncbi:MAG: CoA-binding protein [Deltaproteobacteria bacterium RBG_13_58_19]|nr:MAG: CoA-binding protein [Deltaproteobacteria bacterium RBG_13_58_19]